MQVEPVESGYRITLTYELTADKLTLNQLAVSIEATFGSPLYAALSAALKDQNFMSEGAGESSVWIHAVHSSAYAS